MSSVKVKKWPCAMSLYFFYLRAAVTRVHVALSGFRSSYVALSILGVKDHYIVCETVREDSFA